MRDLHGIDDLVDDIYALACRLIDGILGRALGGIAQHGHVRLLNAGNGLGSLSCGVGDLGELVSSGVRRDGHITHDNDTIVAVLRLGHEQHGAAHAGDAGGALDDLQRRAQGVACSAQRATDLTVSVAALDDHASKIEIVVEHELAGLVDSHALLLTELSELLGILLGLVEMERIDDLGLADVLQTPFFCLLLDMSGVADKNDVGDVVGKHMVGCFQCALFLSLRKNDALLVSFGACHNFF